MLGVTDWITGLFWAAPLFVIPIAFMVRAHVDSRERNHSSAAETSRNQRARCVDRNSTT
jgi:hypothetical protein